jgi:nucleoside-diphosphate-sugar epimerase
VRGLDNLLGVIDDAGIQRVFFTSSTAVYAQTGGEWVDERSETRPSHFSGQRTLGAERRLAAAKTPGTVLRCAGIYGPGRTRLIESVRQGKASMSERFTNRIHRDDIAGAIVHLMEVPEPPPILLLSDDEPAPQREVTTYLAGLVGVAVPAPEAAEPSARGGDKRCNNAKLKATGYSLLFPSYREGYAAMLAATP